jgi:hypothetical protein
MAELLHPFMSKRPKSNFKYVKFGIVLYTETCHADFIIVAVFERLISFGKISSARFFKQQN